LLEELFELVVDGKCLLFAALGAEAKKRSFAVLEIVFLKA
jgi:hypothetical protein